MVLAVPILNVLNALQSIRMYTDARLTHLGGS